MPQKALPEIGGDTGLWAHKLNDFLRQLSPGNTGGVNVWAQRPTSIYSFLSNSNETLGSNHEGLTGINTTNNSLERWTGTNWETLLSSGGSSNSAILQDTNQDTKIEVEKNTNENKIRFSSAGLERMILDADGNFGIGVTEPSSTLDIAGPLTVKGTTSIANSSAGEGRIFFDSNLNKFRVSQNGNSFTDLIVGSPAGNNGQLQFNNSGSFGANSNLVWDNANGRLGIGTASPSTTLEINGITKTSTLETANIRVPSSSVNAITISSQNSILFRAGVGNFQANILNGFYNFDVSYNTNWSTVGAYTQAGFGVGAGYNPGGSAISANITQALFAGTFIPSVDNATVSGRWSGVQINPIFGNGKPIYNSSTPLSALSIEPTINVKTGSTGGYSALTVNTIETSISNTTTNYLAHFQTGGSSKVVITNTGNIGIGITNPTYKLQVNGEPACSSYSTFTLYSDLRLKTNISNLADGFLSKILDLKPVTFNYNELTGYDEATRSKTITGFVAQDLEQIFPDMVGRTINNQVEYLNTNLSALPIYIVKAIQEQNNLIQSQQILVQEQQKQIDAHNLAQNQLLQLVQLQQTTIENLQREVEILKNK